MVIHGIAGARLEQESTGRTVWGAFTGNFVDPNSPAGARAIALPFKIPATCLEFDPREQDVIATGPLETLKLEFLFQIVSVDVYKNILRVLGTGGFRDRVLMGTSVPKYAADHFTCYSFFYDWRRDNVQNAILLGSFIEKARKEIRRNATAKITALREDSGVASLREARSLATWLHDGFRFDIVAHSMGGLIARYYLRYGAHDLPVDGTEPEVTWAGAENIDRLVLISPPNLGSMHSLRRLINGFDPGMGVPHYDQAIIGSMPSVFQLLPRARNGVLLDENHDRVGEDLMDPRLWIDNRWGPLDPAAARTLKWLIPNKSEAARLEQAREYLSWCLERARAFQRSLDKKPELVCPAEIYLFAADSEPTLTRTVLVERDGRIVPDFPVIPETMEFGDTRVSRYSALGDERPGSPWEHGLRTSIPFVNETFLSDNHFGLTNNPQFWNNLLHLLLEKKPRRTKPPHATAR